MLTVNATSAQDADFPTLFADSNNLVDQFKMSAPNNYISLVDCNLITDEESLNLAEQKFANLNSMYPEDQ